MTVMKASPQLGDPGLVGYDDVEKYTHVVFRGKRGWIVDKGDHILPEVEGGHIYIEYENEDARPTELHERLVNKYLKQKSKLWIDIDNHLDPIKTTNATQ